MEDAQVFYDRTMEVIAVYGWSVIGAIVILIVGFWLSGVANRVLKKALRKTGRIDETIVLFLGSVAKYLVIIFTILAVLDQFGVETTSIIALLGAAGLAVGLAMQGTLANIAAGVMLLFFRPFKVGQFVQAGSISGTVKSISLFTTSLDTPDGIRIIVPNGQIWGSAITNYNHNKTRRMQIDVGIAYHDDIGKAIRVAERVLKADKRIKDEPVPQVVVGELGDSSVNLIVRGWATTDDFWGAKFDLTRAVKEAFDKEGIEIPFPQRVVHKA